MTVEVFPIISKSTEQVTEMGGYDVQFHFSIFFTADEKLENLPDVKNISIVPFQGRKKYSLQLIFPHGFSRKLLFHLTFNRNISPMYSAPPLKKIHLVSTTYFLLDLNDIFRRVAMGTKRTAPITF